MNIRLLQHRDENQRGSAVRIAELLEQAHEKGLKQNFKTMVDHEHGNMTYCAYGAIYKLRFSLNAKQMLELNAKTENWEDIISSFGDPAIEGIDMRKLKPCSGSCLLRSVLSITGSLHLSHYIVHMHDCEKLTFTELAAKLREIN